MANDYLKGPINQQEEGPRDTGTTVPGSLAENMPFIRNRFGKTEEGLPDEPNKRRKYSIGCLWVAALIAAGGAAYKFSHSLKKINQEAETGRTNEVSSQLENVTNDLAQSSVNTNVAPQSKEEDPAINKLYNDSQSYYTRGRGAPQAQIRNENYRRSAEACSEALRLIKETRSNAYHEDDFFYMRARAKTHTHNGTLPEIEDIVKDYIAALATDMKRKNGTFDEGIKNQVSTQLYHLLSGKYAKSAEISLQKVFRGYEPHVRKRILANMHQNGRTAAAYNVLVGSK